MLIILHLSCWIGGYVVESKKFKEATFSYYQKGKISVNEKLDLVERDKGPGYLDSLRAKPEIWYKCFSPFPFVFICSEGYVFAPSWGSGRQYIGVFVGHKMVEIMECWSWIS